MFCKVSVIEAKADYILSINDTISSDLIYEQNEISVNDIYLNTVAHGLMADLNDYESDLYEIAVQCPNDGGPAVFFARSLYALINDSIVYDDNNTCTGGIGARHSAQINSQKKIEEMLEVFPNPAKESITVKFYGRANTTYTLGISDVTGRKILVKEFSGIDGINEHLINLQPYSKGIYYLSLRSIENSSVVKVTLIE